MKKMVCKVCRSSYVCEDYEPEYYPVCTKCDEESYLKDLSLYPYFEEESNDV